MVLPKLALLAVEYRPRGLYHMDELRIHIALEFIQRMYDNVTI